MSRPIRLWPRRPLQFPRGLPLLSLLLLSACELTEVTVAPGKRFVVVHAVISRTALEQFVVVEYSQTGEALTGYSYPRIPPGNPRSPISAARVTIEHAGSSACAGRVDTLAERPPMDSRLQTSGTYVGPVCTPEPGEQILLRVETPAGEVVTGGTTVPGASRRSVAVGGGESDSGLPTVVLDRERDTLGIGVTPLAGRALQLEVRNAEDLDHLPFFGFTDTMGISLPGNLVNPFEGDDGESVFRAGRRYSLAVALTDGNYYDFLRSRSAPFTGRGFINHLTGGIGVFGSVETTLYSLEVVAPVDDPREGVYRLTGVVDTVNVDVALELYLDEVQPNQFSAFVRGGWVDGAANLSGDGSFSPAGEFSFYFGTRTADPGVMMAQFVLRGTLQPGGAPFPLELRAFLPGLRATLVDTLTARQISGPGTP